MKIPKSILISPENMDTIDRVIKIAMDSHKSHKIQIVPSDKPLRDRQRALAHIWYKDIGAAMGTSAGYSEALCKLMFGLKLRCLYDDELERIIRSMLSGREFAEKIEIIQRYPEWFPILRSEGGLDVPGQCQYLSEIQRHFAEQGIVLRSANEDELLNLTVPG